MNFHILHRNFGITHYKTNININNDREILLSIVITIRVFLSVGGRGTADDDERLDKDP